MKKILSIALIALIAVTTVMASPVFSGRFGVKYTYTYETGVIAAGNRNYMALTDSDGIWSLDFQGAGFDYASYAGYATINVAEGLKAIDVELPISLAVSIGTTGHYADYVYADPNSKVSGSYDMGLITNAVAPIAVSGGYNGWTATVAAGIETDKQAVAVDVTGTVIDGIDVEAAYSTEGDGQIQASASVNVAKLADLDFTAKVSGYDYFSLADSADNVYLAAVNLGYGPVSGSIEYGNIAAKNGLWAKTAYKVNDLITLGAAVNASNITNFGDTLGFNVNATFKLNGITTYVEASKTAITTYTQFTF